MASLRKSFSYGRSALVNFVLAPFVALAALFGLLIIGVAFLVYGGENTLEWVGLDVSLGGDTLYGFGTKTLPSFYFD